MELKVSMDALEVQLANAVVTTLAVIRLYPDHVSIEFPLPDKYLEATFALVGNEIAVTTRNYPDCGDAPKLPKSETLHRFT